MVGFTSTHLYLTYYGGITIHWLKKSTKKKFLDLRNLPDLSIKSRLENRRLLPGESDIVRVGRLLKKGVAISNLR
jgi:hypothetical protein